MHSPDIEQLIRDGFKRWNRGDHSLDSQWTDPEVEIISAAGVLTGVTYHGHEGVERWVRDISESFDEWTLEVDEVDEFQPGRVLCVGAVHFRGRGSGVDVDLACAWLMDHVGGVLTRLEAFPNRVDEARAIATKG